MFITVCCVFTPDYSLDVLKRLLVDVEEAASVHEVLVLGLGEAGRGLHGRGHVQHVVPIHRSHMWIQ